MKSNNFITALGATALVSALVLAPMLISAFSAPQVNDILSNDNNGALYRVAYVKPIGAGWQTLLQPHTGGSPFQPPALNDTLTNQRDGSQYRVVHIVLMGAGWYTTLQAVA